MTFIIGAMLLGLLPAFIAQSKGGSFAAWWVFGFLLFPLALIAAIFYSPERCPLCREPVRPDAVVCKHCRNPLPPRYQSKWFWERAKELPEGPQKTFAITPLSRSLKMTMAALAIMIIYVAILGMFSAKEKTASSPPSHGAIPVRSQ